jgi:hypothetical protein
MRRRNKHQNAAEESNASGTGRTVLEDIRHSDDEDQSDTTNVDIYGEDPNKGTLLGKTRSVTGAILGDFVAESLFGKEEGPYLVPADFSKFEGMSEADAASFAAAATTVTSKVSHDPSTNNSSQVRPVVGGDEAVVAFGEALLRLRAGACRSLPPAAGGHGVASTREAPALASALHRMCAEACLLDAQEYGSTSPSSNSSGGGGGSGVDEKRVGALMGVLAGACRELSEALLRVEFELKRAQWRKPPRPQPHKVEEGACGGGDREEGSGGGPSPAPSSSSPPSPPHSSFSTSQASLGFFEMLIEEEARCRRTAEGSVGLLTAASGDAPLGALGGGDAPSPTPLGALSAAGARRSDKEAALEHVFTTHEQEELWVLDRLDEVLSKSRCLVILNPPPSCCLLLLTMTMDGPHTFLHDGAYLLV